MRRISVTPHEAHLLACAIEREADQAETENHFDVAEMLAWRAALIREAGR